MRFDYDAVDRGFVSRILDENSRRLSRTRRGVSDTGSSARKRPLLLSGEALRRRSAANERRVSRLLFEARADPPPGGAADLRALLLAVADTMNDGLLRGTRLRTWSIAARQPSLTDGPPVAGPQAKVDPEELPGAIDAYCAEVHRRWPELDEDPVPLAAWAEWELNGGALHPFYDGCGRIARAFGALLLLRGSRLLPLYDGPAAYFAHGNRGADAFASYVRRRIEACAHWLEIA